MCCRNFMSKSFCLLTVYLRNLYQLSKMNSLTLRILLSDGLCVGLLLTFV